MTYTLPATGKPPDGPPLEKIAIEEHVDILGGLGDDAQGAAASGRDEDLQSLVTAMDYDATWMNIVGARLRDFGPDRLAGMDASGITMAILSHTVPGVQGIVDPAAAVTAARQINDRLAAEVRTQPA